jgi:hypothetical protein
MKSILLLLLFPCIVFAQQSKITLTPFGFVSETDTSKNYIVVELQNKSKADLFKQTLIYLNKTYRSPKDVISQVENESITVNGYSNTAIRRNKMHVFDMNYTINFEFKDGKIKINAPDFVLTHYYDGHDQHLFLVANNSISGGDMGIWNKSLKLKSEMAKGDLELFFNTYINEFVSALSKQTDW